MDIKKSEITINLSADEKETFSSFYDFLYDLALKLYEADAEHTEFCSTITHIMEDMMYLYDFWGEVKEEELKSKPESEESSEPSWNYIKEMMTKFLFYDRDDNLMAYPTIGDDMTVRDWLREFCEIYTNAFSVKILKELTKPAFKFFLVYTEFFLIGESAGYYIYDNLPHEWRRVFTLEEKQKFIKELENKYFFTNDMLPIQFISTTNPIDWKNDFLKQSEKFTEVAITSPLSEDARLFFSQWLEFDLPYKEGMYSYNAKTKEWSKKVV